MHTGKQTLARQLYPGLDPDWLLIADHNFYGFADWNTARWVGGAAALRVTSTMASRSGLGTRQPRGPPAGADGEDPRPDGSFRGETPWSGASIGAREAALGHG